jgi:hypothetical protein
MMNYIETPASAREFIRCRNRAMGARRRWAFLKRLVASMRSLTK